MALADILRDPNRYDLVFNGKKGSEYGVIFNGFPKITHGAVQYTTTSVNGRCGDLLTNHGGRGNATIECTFAMLFENVHERFRALRKWLNGSGQLEFSESPDGFYEVLLVEEPKIQRQARNYGLYTVKFIVYPYEFLKSGLNKLSKISENPYCLSMPIYTITGNGECTIAVNNNTFVANVDGSIIIDTRKMQAYSNELIAINTQVTGDYENLFLPSGDIEITATDGFIVEIQPNWGYFL